MGWGQELKRNNGNVSEEEQVLTLSHANIQGTRRGWEAEKS